MVLLLILALVLTLRTRAVGEEVVLRGRYALRVS